MKPVDSSSVAPASSNLIGELQAEASSAAAIVGRSLQPADSTPAQLLRYTVVGGLAFVVDFAMLVALTEIVHLHYLVSGALAFLTGLGVNYTLSVRFVFRVRRVRNRRLEFAIFGVIGLLGLGLNEALLYLFTEVASLHYAASKVGATGVGYLWNFFARKYSLFHSRSQRRSPTA